MNPSHLAKISLHMYIVIVRYFNKEEKKKKKKIVGDIHTFKTIFLIFFEYLVVHIIRL